MEPHNEKKTYSKLTLIEYGAVNDVTESLDPFADSILAVTLI